MSTTVPEKVTALSESEKAAVPADKAEKAERMTRPMKVVVGSSLVLRVAGAMTAILLSSLLRQELNAGPALIGVLYALFYVTELLLSPIFGALSDLRGRRLILVLGPLVGALALPIYPVSALVGLSFMGVVILAIGRLVEGVATAAKVPSALGYLADSTAGEGHARAALRGRTMGMYEASFVVGLVVGQVIGGRLWDGFHVWGFFLVSFVYLIAVGMLYFFVPETLPAEAREHHAKARLATSDAVHPVRALLASRLKDYSTLLSEPALRSFVPAWLAVNAVVGLFGNLAQPLMLREKQVLGGLPDKFPHQFLYGKFSASEAGLMFGIFGTVFMVGIFVWSLLYARIRKSTVMLIGACGLFVTCAALYGINDRVFSLPEPWNVWLWVPFLMVGLFMVSGFAPVALAYLAEISGTKVEHRGAVMGLYSVFLSAGQLIGSGVGGWFIETMHIGFNGLILGTFILAVIALVTILWLRRVSKV
jgi:MFS family permease